MMRVAVVALALALGCAGARDGELDDARAQVRRFFEAAAKGECSALGALLPAASDAAGCAKLLHEWRDDLRIELVDLPDVRRDGRDRRAIIVRATVMRRGQQQTMLVRVTHEQGRWQLVL
jgi:hypothetical protein